MSKDIAKPLKVFILDLDYMIGGTYQQEILRQKQQNNIVLFKFFKTNLDSLYMLEKDYLFPILSRSKTT